MATELALETPAASEPARRRDFGSSARLWGGFFGRAWLWFVAGCLVVTFVPMLFGWRPYVVESGSMQPRIKVGDVILSSPEHDAKKLLGHVTVFKDPDAARAGTVKSHRVVAINPDGTLQTKGDANPTPDPVALPMSDVKGIGRLLVRWIGLPLIWIQQAQWLKLALLVLSFWIAAVLVVRDHDELDGELDNDDEPDDDIPDDDIPDDDLPDRDGPDDDCPSVPLLWKPRASGLRRLARARHRRRLTSAEFARRIGARVALVVATSAALLVPTTQAAMSATTANTAAAWSTAASFGPNYTADTEALNPYIYWKLDDTGSTNVAIDYSGNNRNGQYSPTPSGTTPWTMQVTGGLTGQSPNLAVTATGGASANTSCVYENAAAENPAPNTYSEIIWFKTASTQGGKLIGFESAQTGISNNATQQYDRHIYMDSAGHLTFGVYPTNAAVTVTSAKTYNDNKWHMAVATMGTASGMRLYVDDTLVASGAYTASQNYDQYPGGYWRVGCGNLQGWGNDFQTQTNYGFAGSLDEATVYTTELTAANIDKLWTDINPAPVITGLVNGNFETGNISPWTCTTGSGISTNQHGGTYAASLAPYGFFQAGECDQTITLLPNHTYTLTAWGIRATVGVSGGATGSDSTTNKNYRQLTFTFTTDSTGIVTVYAQGQTLNTGYIDDITIS